MKHDTNYSWKIMLLITRLIHKLRLQRIFRFLTYIFKLRPYDVKIYSTKDLSPCLFLDVLIK